MRIKLEVLTMRDRFVLALLCLFDMRHLRNALFCRGIRFICYEGEKGHEVNPPV